MSLTKETRSSEGTGPSAVSTEDGSSSADGSTDGGGSSNGTGDNGTEINGSGDTSGSVDGSGKSVRSVGRSDEAVGSGDWASQGGAVSPESGGLGGGSGQSRDDNGSEESLHVDGLGWLVGCCVVKLCVTAGLDPADVTNLPPVPAAYILVSRRKSRVLRHTSKGRPARRQPLGGAHTWTEQHSLLLLQRPTHTHRGAGVSVCW